MTSNYGSPKNVSALIRFARWCALGYGIAYGFERYNEVYKVESVIKEEEEQMRPFREKALQDERERISQEAINEIATIFGAVSTAPPEPEEDPPVKKSFFTTIGRR